MRAAAACLAALARARSSIASQAVKRLPRDPDAANRMHVGIPSTSLESEDANVSVAEAHSTWLRVFLGQHLSELDAHGVSRVTFAVVPPSKADEEVPCWFFTFESGRTTRTNLCETSRRP